MTSASGFLLLLLLLLRLVLLLINLIVKRQVDDNDKDHKGEDTKLSELA